MAVCYTKATLKKKLYLQSPCKPIRDLCLFHKPKTELCVALSLVFVKNSNKLPLYIDKVAHLSLNSLKSPIDHQSYRELQMGIRLPPMSIISCCKSETFRQQKFQTLFKAFSVFLTKYRVYTAIDGTVGVTK